MRVLSEDAREIVNDVFLKVFKKIETYNPDLPFKPWLNKITVFTAIDYYRKNIKNELRTEGLDLVADIADSNDLLDNISSDDLRGLVQQLSPACRAAINLYAIEGYNHHEIASILGISVGASKSNLFKARAKLKILIQEQELIKSYANS